MGEYSGLTNLCDYESEVKDVIQWSVFDRPLSNKLSFQFTEVFQISNQTWIP